MADKVGRVQRTVNSSDRTHGWVSVLTLWTNNFIWIGVTKGLGIMLPTLRDQLATQTWIIGWILAIVMAMGGFVSPFAGLLGKRFGTGYVIMTCSVLIGAASIAGSLIENAFQLALVYMLMAGTGLGVSNVLAKEAVALSFTENYATATGIARTGYSIGLFVFGPLVQLFLHTYGWRGSLLLIGGISMHGVVSGALLATAFQLAPAQYQKLPQNKASPAKSFSVKLLIKYMRLELFGSVRYWAIAVVACSNTYAYCMWIVYFVSQAQSLGFSVTEAGTFVTVAGFGNLVAKLFQGFVTDYGVMSSITLSAVSVTVTSAAYCASSWMTSRWTMMTSAFLILFGDGVLSSQGDVLVKQILGDDLVAAAFGWISLKSAMLVFSLGFLPGWMYDTTGSYTAAFLMVGIVQGFALPALIRLRFVGPQK